MHVAQRRMLFHYIIYISFWKPRFAWVPVFGVGEQAHQRGGIWREDRHRERYCWLTLLAPAAQCIPVLPLRFLKSQSSRGNLDTPGRSATAFGSFRSTCFVLSTKERRNWSSTGAWVSWRHLLTTKDVFEEFPRQVKLHPRSKHFLSEVGDVARVVGSFGMIQWSNWTPMV